MRFINKIIVFAVSILISVSNYSIAATPVFDLVDVSGSTVTMDITWPPGGEPGGQACQSLSTCDVVVGVNGQGYYGPGTGSLARAPTGFPSWGTAQSVFGSATRRVSIDVHTTSGNTTVCMAGAILRGTAAAMWMRPNGCSSFIVQPPQSCTINAQNISFGIVELADLNGSSLPVRPTVTCRINGTVNIILRSASSNSSVIDFGSGLTGTLTNNGSSGATPTPLSVVGGAATAVNGLITLNSPAYVKTGDYSASAVAIVDFP